jgi:hypothetical protein
MRRRGPLPFVTPVTLPLAARLCSVIAAPGTRLIWTPACRHSSQAPALHHEGFYLLWTSLGASTSSFTHAEPWERVQLPLTFITISLNWGQTQPLWAPPDLLGSIDGPFLGAEDGLGGFRWMQIVLQERGAVWEHKRLLHLPQGHRW